MADQQTVILRFRDLVTGPGEAISRHREIAEEKGAVWWGWWHKHGETVPDETFRILAKHAKRKEGLVLFLFDSGRMKTYQCLCKELKWHQLHERITTPDKNLTPTYYDQAEYLAWFRLVSFEEVPESVFKQYTYYRVEDFFEDKISRYEPFYDKRVYHLEELKQQDRTIWFVRPFRSGDHSHQIELLDSAQIKPEDFPHAYIQTSSQTLIWTSDLHFGHHGFPITSTAHQSDLAQALDNAIRDHKIDQCGGLIISGDLTWRASAEEFERADNFIRKMMKTMFSLPSQTILPCPGNHDLAFSKSPEDKAARIHDKIVPAEAKAAYAGFYEKLFYKQPNQYLSCGRKFLLAGCIPVEIVALNSSFLEQKEGWFQGHGFVGKNQLRHAAREMGWVAGADIRPFRIVVLHHHLMPVTYSSVPMGGYPYSVVLDAEAVVTWIVKHRVDLVLHGHMHHSFTARVSRPCHHNRLDGPWHTFHVAGLSSTGVASDHTDEDNSFACLTFGLGEATIDWYGIDPGEKSQHLRKLTIPRGVVA